MSRIRIFIDSERISHGQVLLSGKEAKRLTRVLRLKPGDAFTIVDSGGNEHRTELVEAFSDRALARFVAESPTNKGVQQEDRPSLTETTSQVVLAPSLLKGQRMDWLIQKATELGVGEFVPVISERTVVKLSPTDLLSRRQRWQQIACHASEQSGRTRVPSVHTPRTFVELIDELTKSGLATASFQGTVYMVHEGTRGTSLRSALQKQESWDRIFSLIGPEGGFTAQEAERAEQAGIQLVHLGPRILRAETAGLVALTLILCQGGDLD